MRPLRRLSALILLAASATAPAAALAHHSYGMFDRTKRVEFTATVKTFDWTNPHSHLLVDAQGADGSVRTWNLEMDPPGGLVRHGWKRSSLKPGDKVTVRFVPLREDLPGGHLEWVIAPDGTKLTVGVPTSPTGQQP